MEQKYTKFPYFGKGELLTSDSLNNSFGYNDEQTRLSRCYLSGFGIVEGLTYSYKNGSLIIKPGVGITPSGFMVKIDKDIEFSKVEIGQSGDSSYRLCTSKEKGKNIVAFPKNIAEYVIELRMSVKTVSTIHCSELSCDARATEKEVMMEAYICKNAVCGGQANELAMVGDRFGNFSRMSGCVTNINVLKNKMMSLFKKNLANVNEGLLALCRILNPDFISVKESRNTLMPLSCWGMLFGGSSSIAKGLFLALKRFQSDWHTKMTVFPMYYFQYLENMTDAIRECIDFYNEFVSLYPVIGGKGKYHKDSIFLGMVGKGLRTNRYRSFFASAADGDMNVRAKQLECLLRRVIAMSESFIEGNNFSGSMEFAWANPDSPLAERFIPYYYKKDEKLSKYWRNKSMSSSLRFYDYGMLNGVSSVCDTKGGKHLFLQGCYQKNVHEVYKKLTDYITANHLDIEVEKVLLSKETLPNGKGKKRVNSYSKILLDTISKESYRKDLGSDNDKVVYSSFLRHHGNLDSFVNNAVWNLEIDTPSVKKINDMLRNITIDSYLKILNADSPEKPTVVWQAGKNKARSPKVSALMALKSYYLKSYIPEYDGAEYLHGCPNGAKLLLFYFDDKLFFEASVKK